jgi:hypothetical protein
MSPRRPFLKSPAIGTSEKIACFRLGLQRLLDFCERRTVCPTSVHGNKHLKLAGFRIEVKRPKRVECTGVLGSPEQNLRPDGIWFLPKALMTANAYTRSVSGFLLVCIRLSLRTAGSVARVKCAISVTPTEPYPLSGRL